MLQQATVVHTTRLPLSAYAQRATASNQFHDDPEAVSHLRFGLFGEIGGLLAAVKKAKRDLGVVEQAVIKEELGDALWYLTMVATQTGTTLPDLGRLALVDLQRRLRVTNGHDPSDDPTFSEFDGLVDFGRSRLPGPTTRLLSELAAHAGQILAESDVAGTNLVAHPLSQLLATLLADIVLVAASFDLHMAAVAEANLQKTEDRWPPPGTEAVPLFDDGLDELEQLPRELRVMFIERQLPDGEPFVIQQINGVNIGDRLTDNRADPDGYRFHDVFHLAYVAHLGWSPVIRGLLKRKRKSDPQLDQNQDGARAMIIEEGIATWIFNHAYRRNYFAETGAAKLEYSLLKQVKDMVQGYEVADCPLWQWERAILEGFKVFRQLRDAGCGVVAVDMLNRTIAFEELPPEKMPRGATSQAPRVRVGAALPLGEPK